MTENLEKCMKAFFDTPTYSVMDSFSPKILRELSETERTEAERLLLQALYNGSRDSRIIEGLGELKSKAASDILKKRLPNLNDTTSLNLLWTRHPLATIEIALALWNIEKFSLSLDYILTALKHSDSSNDSKYNKIQICLALRHFPFKEALVQLCDIILDSDTLVRCHVVQTIMFICGKLTNELEIPPQAIKIMSEDKNIQADAINELLETVKDCRLPSISMIING